MESMSDAVRQYRDEGYCLVRKLIPQETIDAVRGRVEAIINDPDTAAQHSLQVLDPSRYCGEDGRPLPGGIQLPSRADETCDAMAKHPNLVAAMTELLGGEVKRYTDQIGTKFGVISEEQGGRSYFHQDSYYWHIDPELGCNCWIPLQPVGRDAIALAVMPRSQVGWTLHEHETYLDDPPMGSVSPDFHSFGRHRIPLDQIDDTDEALVEMEAGDGLFFTNYTWHRSEPNRTGRNMMFYAIAYQLTEAAIAARAAAAAQ